MSARNCGSRRSCQAAPPPSNSVGSAFVLVILPETQHPPVFEDHYSLVDPYYSCPETALCGCPLWAGNRHWKVEGAVPGGVFDGRVRGCSPLGVEDWMSAEDRLWDHNLVRPLDMAAPVSARRDHARWHLA